MKKPYKVPILVDNKPLKTDLKNPKTVEQWKGRTPKITLDDAIFAVQYYAEGAEMSSLPEILKMSKQLRYALTTLQSIKIIGEAKISACQQMYELVRAVSVDGNYRIEAKEILKQIEKFGK